MHVVSALSVIVPTQPPCCQPLKREVLSSAAVSVICVPARYCIWHSVPQSMPAGDEVTRPIPVPLRLTVRLSMPPTACTLWLAAAATYAMVPFGWMARPTGVLPTDAKVLFRLPFDAECSVNEPSARFVT